MIDFGYRATHEMTLKSKELVKAFYDRGAQYSYFKGCSTGGRMA
jgi:feruloyl esterase